LAGAVEQDVSRLEVAVDDAGDVDGCQGGGHLPHQGHGLGRVLEAPLPAQAVGQALALYEGHDDVRPAGVLADVVDGADVGVPDGGRRPRLAQEPLPGGTAGVVPAAEGRHLDGHDAVQLWVKSPADHAHAPGAQAADDLVAAQPLG
jgi:hypothetical protein